MILNNIGRAYRILGNFSESLKYLKEALNMLQNLYKDHNPFISNVLGNIGLAYQGLGDISEGLKYLKEALKINQELYQGNHSSIANSLNDIGSAYQDLGDISEGLKYQEAALEMLQELPRSNPSSIAMVLNNIGLVSQISKGLKYLEAALKTFQTVFQWNHPDVASFLFNIGLAYEQLKDINKSTELYKQSYLMFIQTLGLEHHYTKKLESYLEKNAPEFIKNNETREFILQRGDFEEVTLEIKQKIQKRVLNKIYINAVKDKWNSKFSILGNWGVKGYLSDRYLAKQLGVLANVKNIEIAKMLCFEAICLGAINSPSKNFACVKEFAKAYPALINKIATEHPEYFIDGSILRICVSDEVILSRLLNSG